LLLLVIYPLALRRAVHLGVQVFAPLISRLVYLHLDAMSVGIWVLANACNLPGDLAAGLATCYLEAVNPAIIALSS
jgi:hypothetical protein